MGWTKAAGVVIQGLGMLGQRSRNQRAMNQQRDLMDHQAQNQETMNRKAYERQRMLNQQGNEMQYDMWKKTNFPAQVGMMKEAGLNPAMMYGMGGAGGSTTGSQSGGSAPTGSAAGGNAPQQPNMDMQNLLLGAQIENIKADTGLKQANAENTGEGTKGLAIDNAMKEIDKLYLGEKTRKEIAQMIAQTTGQNIENQAKNIGLQLKQNGIHNETIATVIGTLTGWDLTEAGAMDKKIELLPKELQGVKEMLEPYGIKLHTEMTRRQVLGVAVGAYIAGKMGLGKLTEIWDMFKGDNNTPDINWPNMNGNKQLGQG